MMRSLRLDEVDGVLHGSIFNEAVAKWKVYVFISLWCDKVDCVHRDRVSVFISISRDELYGGDNPQV